MAENNKNENSCCYSFGKIKTTISDRTNAEMFFMKSHLKRKVYRGFTAILLFSQCIWSIIIQPNIFWFMYTNWALFTTTFYYFLAFAWDLFTGEMGQIVLQKIQCL